MIYKIRNKEVINLENNDFDKLIKEYIESENIEKYNIIKTLSDTGLVIKNISKLLNIYYVIKTNKTETRFICYTTSRKKISESDYNKIKESFIDSILEIINNKNIREYHKTINYIDNFDNLFD